MRVVLASDLRPGEWYRRGPSGRVCRVLSPSYRFGKRQLAFHDVEVWGCLSNGRVLVTRTRADVEVVLLGHADVLAVLDEQRVATVRASALDGAA